VTALRQRDYVNSPKHSSRQPGRGRVADVRADAGYDRIMQLGHIASAQFVNAVVVAGSPVGIATIAVMGIRCAGILATVRSCVLASAVVRAACR